MHNKNNNEDFINPCTRFKVAMYIIITINVEVSNKSLWWKHPQKTVVNLTDLKKAKSCIKAYILEGYVCFLVLKNKKHCISSESTWKKYFEGNSLK